ncbi:MAG: glycosyltransferase family 2 protein [Candidatus Zixiibacteriota bacterium]
MDTNPVISIIIVHHRTEEILPACLQAIFASAVDIPFEVLLVNNPATQTIPKSITEEYTVRIIGSHNRLGFGSASNIGARQARGEYLLFMNPDIIVKPNAIQVLYDYCIARDNTFVTGRLTHPDGSFQPSCRRFPTVTNILFARQSFLGRLFGNSANNYTLPDYATDTKVDSAAAALLMMPKKSYDNLNGFDESFFMYMEDTDLCYRHTLKGGDIVYAPLAEASHGWGTSTGKYRFRRIVWHHLSMWKYFVKHYRSPGGILFILLLLFVNCCLSLLIELFSFRP